MRAKNTLASDGNDKDDTSHWVDEFKRECLKRLEKLATENGVLVEAMEIMDRRLHGNLGAELEQQAEKVLQNQIQGTQIALQNKIQTEQQEGKLQVAKVQQEVVRTEADTKYYAEQRAADAALYACLKKAEGEAKASAVIAEQAAKNTILLAEAERQKIENIGKAYASVDDPHAQRMQACLLQVEARKALPPTSVVFEGGNGAAPQQVENALLAAQGFKLAEKMKS